MRDLDPQVLEDVAEKFSGLLSQKPLRFNYQGLTLVAKKSHYGKIRVLTAWKTE